MQDQQGHARTLRLASVGISLLLLLGLVAFASRSGVTQHSNAQPTPGYVSWAMSIFLIFFVLMIPFAVYVYSIQMREFRVQNKRQRSFQSRLVRSLGMLFIVFALFGLRSFLHRHNAFPTVHLPWLDAAKTQQKHAAASKQYNPEFQWPVLWATLALLAAGAAWWWFDLRHRLAAAVPLEAEPTVEEDVAAEIGDAISDLEAEPDPRRAVIAAYARMERVFGRHGLQRRLSETPVEYLRRILLGLTSRTEAVSRLTLLFELAKFSSHEIDGRMKQDAIDALRSIRDDLQAAPA